jgi:hypothetical protein
MIFEVLDGFYGIETALVGMYPTNDQYARPPFLRFRFRNREKADPVYGHVQDIVAQFRGNLKWTVWTSDTTPNHLLIPEPGVAFLRENRYKKEVLSLCWGNEGYHSFIDQAIADISALADFLAGNLHKY